MAAQHLPRDLVRPSSGFEELFQNKKEMLLLRFGIHRKSYCSDSPPNSAKL